MSHVICQEVTEGALKGSVEVATCDKMPRDVFFNGYVATMKAAGAEFDRVNEKYTLTGDAWVDVIPKLEAAGITWCVGKIVPAPAKVKKLNATEKFAFKGVAAHLKHLLAVIEGGEMSGEDKLAIKRIMKAIG